MSSGRTAGVKCRTTIRSIAHPAYRSSAARRSTSSVTTAARASKPPDSLAGQAFDLDAVRGPGTPQPPVAASSRPTPGRTTSHWDASSRSARAHWLRPTTSITSIPSGRAASSLVPHFQPARAAVSESSRYSASLAVPVGAPPAYEIFGCGENPAEYAIGKPAMRTPRSTARAISLWLAKRILPLLAYLIDQPLDDGRRERGGPSDGLRGRYARPPGRRAALQDAPVNRRRASGHVPPGSSAAAAACPLGARSGSRCPWPGRRRSRSRGSSGSPRPPRHRPGRWRPASPATASRGPGPASRWSQGSTSSYVAFPRRVPGQVHAVAGQGPRRAALPALEREVLAPAVEPGAVLPGGPDDLGHPAVAAGQQALHDRRLAVVVAEADGRP